VENELSAAGCRVDIFRDALESDLLSLRFVTVSIRCLERSRAAALEQLAIAGRIPGAAERSVRVDAMRRHLSALSADLATLTARRNAVTRELMMADPDGSAFEGRLVKNYPPRHHPDW